ncbi:hypothetical protein [Desulfovibrio desulfuricans]|uniref:hypothetical protein n=1 Tax=Desulfovibrio desulfuricans TaxID=876 RepID=UPI001CE13540|nr:hypothetical protein [Desulfovibrio desulfuricans]
MQKAENKGSETQGKPASSADKGRRQDRAAWYAGPYKDALIYLMVAIFFVEMIVGGISFFYGVMHAVPDVPGGPPLARFPWFGWAVAAVLAPVGLMLIVHLSGTWVSRYLGREDSIQGGQGSGQTADDEQVPERLRRFYAIIRNAPTVVLLLGIMLLGAGLFFVDGAFSALMRLGGALTEYIPWIAGSLAALIAVCYLVHRWFVYRHHRMQQEYEYRREVLERTGIVLVDKGCIPLPQNEVQRLALGGHVVEAQALPPALDAEAAPGDAVADRNGTAGHDDDVTDAEIISPDTANLSENEADATPADSAASPADASKPVDASADASAADEAEKPRKQG